MKKLQVSTDQLEWFDLPASDSDLEVAADILDNTTFNNQGFTTSQTGLKQWQISANSRWRGSAAYCAKIYRGGEEQSFSDEPATHLGDGVYQIDDLSLTPLKSVTVERNGVEQELIDAEFLFGKIKTDFTSGTVTFSGTYTPLEEIGEVSSYGLTQSRGTNDVSTFKKSCESGGFKFFSPSLKSVGLDLEGFRGEEESFKEARANRETLVMAVEPQGSAVIKGFFKPYNYSSSGDVGSVETETTEWRLSGEFFGAPYGWDYGDLGDAQKLIVDSWLKGTEFWVRYLNNNNDGKVGKAIVTATDLEGQVEGLNTFSNSLQGTGKLRLTNPSLNIIFLEEDNNTAYFDVKDPAYVADDSEGLVVNYLIDEQDTNTITITAG